MASKGKNFGDSICFWNTRIACSQIYSNEENVLKRLDLCARKSINLQHSRVLEFKEACFELWRCLYNNCSEKVRNILIFTRKHLSRKPFLKSEPPNLEKRDPMAGISEFWKIFWNTFLASHIRATVSTYWMEGACFLWSVIFLLCRKKHYCISQYFYVIIL